MEFVPANNLEQLLPEPGVTTGLADRSANRTDDRFEHHLQPPTTTGPTSAPRTNESQPEESEAGSDAQPVDDAPVEIADTDNDLKSSADAGDVDSAEPEADAGPLEEPATRTKESQSNGAAQTAITANAPEQAITDTGQNTVSNTAETDIGMDELPDEKTASKTSRTAQPESGTPQDEVPGQAGPPSEEQGTTGPTETPAEESHEARDAAKTLGRARSGDNIPAAANKPGHDHKVTAEPDNSAHQLKTEQWTDLPESGNKESQSPPPNSDHRGAVDGNTLNGEAKGDVIQGRMRESAAARSTDGAREDGELNRGEQARLVQRVSRAVASAQQRGGPLRLRLSPPELGSLRLEVTVEKGVLSAKIEAESQMARAVLLDNLPQLRDRLSEQGVQIENFDVDVSDHSTDHAQQHTDDAHNHADQRADQPPADQQQQEEKGSPTQIPRSLSKGKLNIVV